MAMSFNENLDDNGEMHVMGSYLSHRQRGSTDILARGYTRSLLLRLLHSRYTLIQ